jgi:tetraacyldisaccharide 4'-kinase
MTRRELAWRRLIGDERASGWNGAARAGLWLCAAAYGAGVRAYRAGYDLGLVRVERFGCPVVGVGNLTLGGTGKTTTVAWLARELLKLGETPAILSRGYGRREGGPATVVADRDGVRAGLRESGDEPQMLARALPGVPILVGKNRRVSGRLARDRFGATACILDDSFQYWRLAKDLEILLIDATRPLQDGRLFPRGLLREPLRALQRAHAVVLTHADRASPSQLADARASVAALAPSLPVAETRHRPGDITRLGSRESAPQEEMRTGRWLAFSSLGDPDSFAATLAGLGLEAEHLPFPDHHPYSVGEQRQLAARAEREGFRGLLTTEKDAVKLEPALFESVPCWVLAVELEFLRGGESILELLRRSVAANR